MPLNASHGFHTDGARIKLKPTASWLLAGRYQFQFYSCFANANTASSEVNGSRQTNAHHINLFLLSDPLQAAAQLALELVVLLVWVVLLLLYRC